MSNSNIVPVKDGDLTFEARLKSVLSDAEAQPIFLDASAFVQAAIHTLSLHQSLALRNRRNPKSALLRDQFTHVRFGYGDEQWILEVETWFMKAIVDTLLRLRLGATYTMNPDGMSYWLIDMMRPKATITDWSTSGRVLLRNPNYANLNWIGFCSVTGAAIFICLTSYDIERIFDVGSRIIRATACQARLLGIKVRYLCRWILSTILGAWPPLWLLFLA
jgi:hypothetical protein